MQQITLSCTLLVVCMLAGCDSSSGESQSAEINSSSKTSPSKALPANNPDLLSIDGELFPLSPFFGVCVRYKGVWDALLRSGPPGPHYPSGGEITVEGGMKLKIGVGKFGMLPGTVLKDVPATSPPRRIQIGHDRFDSFVLVSDFENAGNNRVSIGYDEKDADTEAAAIRLANNVVACHVSAVPVKPKGK